MLMRIKYSLRNLLFYRTLRRGISEAVSEIYKNIDVNEDAAELKRLMTIIYLDKAGLILDGSIPSYTYFTPCQRRAIEAVKKFGYTCGLNTANSNALA